MSHYLKCTNFGFTIPSGGTIEGIQVEWEANASSGGTINDNAVRVVKGGTIGTADKSNTTAWQSSDTFRSYGGSSDLWSTTWAPSDINATNFGAAVSAIVNGGNSKPANVDSVRITVSYVTCGNGVIDGSEQCDDGAANGTAGSCCAADCTFKANGTACTDDGNPCTTDICNGSSNLCQHPAGNAGTVCRAAANECDLAETCTGTSTSCPADTVKAAGTACTDDGNVCTADVCNGTVGAPACTHPAGNAGTICRTSAGVCDPAETCTGTTTTCPADAKSTAGTICRPSAGACDVAEMCDGTSNNCPADAKRPAGTVCGSSGGVCDVAPTCDGTSNSCPAGTATTLGAAPATSKFHTSVTLTATVTGCDSTPVTEGSVTFIDGGTCSSPGTILAGPTAVNGSGQASFSTSSLTVGTHTVTACYSDTSPNFSATSGNATETVSARIQII